VRVATIVYSPTVLLDGVKSISYAANSLATRLAVERGADQALLVSRDDHVLEGSNFAAFFAFGEDERFYTPPLAEGILDSITRRHLMSLVPIEERRIHVGELAGAREGFIASSIREVLPVSHVDGVPLKDAPGRLTSKAAAIFGEHVRSQAESVPV
jgi:branched-chain amino acid aminotransferase